MLNRLNLSAHALFKIGLICIAVGTITLTHDLTAPEAGIRHVIFREVYFFPIILGGFWFGLRGGLTTALAISILYGPLVLTGPDKLSAHYFGNIMEIVLFNLIGGLLGWLKDREIEQLARLREAENLAAMGRATAMIAHDLKTPLITIAGLARRLTGKIPPATPESEKIVVIRQQAERLEKLVMDMLFFAKPMKLRLEPNNLHHLLADAKQAVQEALKYSEMDIDLPAEATCACLLDYEKMMLVLTNLFMNAIEASPRGETVSVTVRHYTDELSIDVSDRGTGVPDDIAGKIFEPFITGKQKGTGLGLPICRKIVEAHSGKLQYRNNGAIGTTFRIILPQVS